MKDTEENADYYKVVKEDGSVKPARFVAQKMMKAIDEVNALPYALHNGDQRIPVMEVFRTIEGEGMHIGTPRVLARIGGCAVGCKWCDTKHSWTLKTSELMRLDDLIARIQLEAAGKVQQVSLTGGEPMHYPRQLQYLVLELRKQRFNVSLETSGMVMNDAVFALFDYISMDIKSPSSGVPMPPAMLAAYQALWNWHGRVQFKVVITDQRDLDWVTANLDWLYTCNPQVRSPLILTPGVLNTQHALASGNLAKHLLHTIDMICEWNQQYNIRVIAQQHQLLVYP